MWKRKSCGCIKADLPRSGKVIFRCERHMHKGPTKKRLLAFFNEDGIAHRG